MARSEENDSRFRTVRRQWSSGRAFILGAIIGSIMGIISGTISYGTLDAGFLFNFVLGGLFIGGVTMMILAMIWNWFYRNPV